MAWRYLFGAILAVLGLGYLVEQVGFFEDGQFMRVLALWWPALIAVFGLNQLIRQRHKPWGALGVLAAGLIALTFTLMVQEVAFHQRWGMFAAVGVVVLGTRMLLPSGARPGRTPGAGTQKGHVRFEHALQDVVVLKGMQFKNDSQKFQGGTVNAVVGDYELDLTGAMLSPTGAELRIIAVFGGVHIRVSPAIPVTLDGTPVFANIDNHSHPMAHLDPGRPGLRIRAIALAGTVEISN